MKPYQKITTGGLALILGISGLLGCSKYDNENQKIAPKPITSEVNDTTYEDPAIGIRDINNDGLNDIVYTNRKETFYLKSLGNNKFGNPIKIVEMGIVKDLPIANMVYLTIEDITGDGLADIIIGDNQGIFILVNQDNTNFELHPYFFSDE